MGAPRRRTRHAGRHAREHHPFIGDRVCAESLPELSARNDVEVRCDVNAWVDIDATVLSTRDAGVGRFGAMVDEAAGWGAYLTLLAQGRQCAGQPPLVFVISRAALGHNIVPLGMESRADYGSLWVPRPYQAQRR